MGNELIIHQEYNAYPDIISYDNNNITVRSPYATNDLSFYQTKESLADIDTFRNFLKNAESRFRASREYKAYKAYLIQNIGIDRCQIFGNITTDDAEIELHHNVLGLFDIALLITMHVINTVGFISSFDLIELIIQEHWQNRVGITFLSKTAHQVYTHSIDSYIPPEMTFGKWWELLSAYKYGITYEIANKVINYINKYNDKIPTSIDIPQNETILSYAYYNEMGMDIKDCGFLPNMEEFDNTGGYFNGF